MSTSSSESVSERESGSDIHKRETSRQIYLPFAMGIIVLVATFLVLALQPDALWRDRVQAIGDLLYTWLCALPLLICLLPVYVILLLSIYGMRKLHAGTASPLVKVENLANSLATRIETGTRYVNEKTISFRTAITSLEQLFSIFDKPSTDKPASSDIADKK